MRINNKVYKFMVKSCYVLSNCANGYMEEVTTKRFYTNKQNAKEVFDAIRKHNRELAGVSTSVTLYSSNYSILDKFTKVN